MTVIVRARLAALNREVEQAAMDLGATRLQTLRLVSLPALWPAILAAGLLVFALTFDDFVLSFFTTGESPQPLPVRIYSAIRFGVKPTINADRDVDARHLDAPDRRSRWRCRGCWAAAGSSIATVMGEETEVVDELTGGGRFEGSDEALRRRWRRSTTST